MNNKIEKDDITVLEFALIKNEDNILMAKLEPTNNLLRKFNIKKSNNYYIEIYFNYYLILKTSEFEILIFDKDMKIKKDIFIESGKNELDIIKTKISKKLKNLKMEGEITYVENNIP